MPKTVVNIGPQDHGRRMSLEEFDLAEAQEGHLYELCRGIISVSEVPSPRHFAQVDNTRDQLTAYKLTHSGRIHRIGGGADCKLLLLDLDIERHPDIAVYKTPRPDVENVWAVWIPEIVIEIVSPSSAQRDYEEKPAEYFLFGVREYWILDADRREMRVLRRSGDRWTARVIRPPQVYRTRLLPGLEFSCAQVFQAADEEGA